MERLTFSPAVARKLAESGLDVVVTGGGGWLGQATLEMLESSLGTETISRVHAYASSRRSMTLRSGTQIELLPLDELPRLRTGAHLVAHFAFATRETVSELGIAKFITRNEGITELMEGHVRRSRPVGMVMLSSGAVYLGDELETNPYGVLKARDERRFLGIAEEMGQSGPAPRLVVPRLFNLAGPFLNKTDHYLLGSIIEDIARGGPIRIHAARPVVRSYVHVADLVDLSFAVMLGDGPVPMIAFDTAGECEVEAGELADLAAAVLGSPGMSIQRPPLDGSRPDRYVGDASVLDELSARYGIEMRDLASQIEDTARYLLPLVP
jgi:nucleoside-diphosphate-sugar epimerase